VAGPPALARQEVLQQLGAQQGPGFTAQALNHMAQVNPPQCLLTLVAVQPWQGFNELAAQEQIKAVMAQMDVELFANQP